MEDIIILNEKEFLVLKTLNYNNNNYIYAISTDGNNTIALVKEVIVDNEVMVESIENQNEFKQVMEEIIKSNL